MKNTQIATAVLAVSLFAAPVAMAQTAAGNNGANTNAAASNNGVGTNNAGGGNNATGANAGGTVGANGTNANGMPSQRVGNEMASGAGAIMTIAPSGVREVQQALNRLGYAAGQVNGVWDQAAAHAMLNFQQAHGLEPTGNLNLSSIAALGLWNNLIGDPLGNGNKALAANNGAPPPRGGKNAANVGGEPLPSQRITNEAPGGGGTTGSAGSGNANR